MPSRPMWFDRRTYDHIEMRLDDLDAKLDGIQRLIVQRALRRLQSRVPRGNGASRSEQEDEQRRKKRSEAKSRMAEAPVSPTRLPRLQSG